MFDGTEIPDSGALDGIDDPPAILLDGEITSCELIPWGSNYTFAVWLCSGADQARAIYKPQRGEVPLYDFPHGTLFLRERAAYLVSRLLGWDFVPPTIIRNGPHGIGSVQLYVEHDERRHFFDFRADRREELQRIALFDLLANNADRKAAHCLLGRDGKVWGIDHGLTFHAVPKLRTVIWEFCGQPIPTRLVEHLATVMRDGETRQAIEKTLCQHLSRSEVEAFFHRMEAILRVGRYPLLDRYRNTPRPAW